MTPICQHVEGPLHTGCDRLGTHRILDVTDDRWPMYFCDPHVGEHREVALLFDLLVESLEAQD